MAAVSDARAVGAVSRGPEPRGDAAGSSTPRTVRLCLLGFGSVARAFCALLAHRRRVLAERHGLRVARERRGHPPRQPAGAGRAVPPADAARRGRRRAGSAAGGSAGRRAPARVCRRRPRRAHRDGARLRAGGHRPRPRRVRPRHGRGHRQQGAHRLELGARVGGGARRRPPHPLREHRDGRAARVQPARVHAPGLPPARLRGRVQRDHQLHHRRDGPGRELRRGPGAHAGGRRGRGRPVQRRRRLGRRLQGGGPGQRRHGRRASRRPTSRRRACATCRWSASRRRAPRAGACAW